MTETAHTPLIVGNGGYAHGAEFEIRTADASDRYVTGIPWADVNAPESGTMLTYGEAHDMAHRIVQAVNSHHRLVEALEEARTELSITRTNIMCEINRCADPRDSRWEGVPEILKERIAKIDAAIKEAGR